MSKLNDANPEETKEWLDALESVIDEEGIERAHFLIDQLNDKAVRTGRYVPITTVVTPYSNTISPLDEERMPGDMFMERQIRGIIRWNALAMVMRDVDGLAFYNGGKIAGASQPHKHLQLIPMPMAPCEELPFSEALNQLKPGHPNRSPDLKFRHAGMLLPESTFDDTERAAEVLHTIYSQLREELEITDDGIQTTAPYNLLITRKWMLMVPRSEESFEGISFNSLAFVGALLVRTDEDREKLKANGLMNTLVGVC